MSGATFDKTLINTDRRNPSLREYEVESVMANYIVETYPKFVELLKEYFHFMEEEYSPARLVNELFNTRDISSTDLELLQFVEDEYLLGQSYFQGFVDKREAAKYSNTLYRSKGSKFSIQQFFRTFYNIDPDIVYTKDQVFMVGEDQIGAESQRYITDDKLYQKYAILIKSDLAIDDWRETYKLFAHPAGMYLGAQVQIVGVVDLDIENQPDPGLLDIPPYVIEGQAGITIEGYAQHTALFDFGTGPGEEMKFRTTLGNVSGYPNPAGNDLADVADLSIENVANLYSSVGEFLEPNSPTLDDDADFITDSDGIRSEFDQGTHHAGFDISSTETIDQDQFTWTENPYIDSDNSAMFALLDSDGNGNKVAFQDSDGEVSLDELL